MSRQSSPQSSPEQAETIFALASGGPPAAISVIRISGPAAHDAGTLLAGSLPPPRMAAVRRLTSPSSGELLDEALLLRFDGPASATGEDVVELHCHGGRAVVAAVLAALGGLRGLRLAEPGEFTRRAFGNGRIDLTQAEGLADLIEAETQAQRRAALHLAEGGLRSQVETWRDRLVEMSARAELAIDYADEEDEVPDGEDALRVDCRLLAEELAEWLERPSIERLKNGMTVVVAGPPNVGKSSLVNAIAGYERVIVSPEPGTTRDHVELPLAIGGSAIVLTDTAGVRETGDAVEAAGVSRATVLAQSADILVWLGDGDPPRTHDVILVHSRADLPGRRETPAGRVALSIPEGRGVGELVTRIVTLSGETHRASDILLNQRQHAAIVSATDALHEAARSDDTAVVAHSLRQAIVAFDLLSGRRGFKDVLDALFSRFCLGK